ncbi:MAG: EFR1 family ferrodoxin [Ruminococcus sp.]|nr:EFR1 family ferrodoxin [Ruminococcus sp.]MDD6448068.1 EFR1 family ferrodoxin [Ruminococcus sp.]
MVGIYLSGTGNTKYCVEKLISLIDMSAEVIAIESPDALTAIQQNEVIFIGYPTQFSNAPYMVRDFIKKNADIWKHKKILCIATMGVFSGDGAGCTARLLKKCGATILGGVHIRMPDAVCDSKLLKKTIEENRDIIARADEKIENVASQIKKGVYPQEGITLIAHMIGLFGQRLWFYKKTKDYSDKLKINNDCIGCGKCVSVCPMNNLYIKENKAMSKNHCTMCYRCISLCPKKAITLLGKEVIEQCRIERYM